MKKLILSTVVAITAGVGVNGAAQAATATTTLDVSASVGTVCSVATTPVSFGTVDPAAGGSTTGAVDVTCTVGTPYTIALDMGGGYNGSWRTMNDGLANTLQYGLYDPTGTTEWSDVGYGDTYPWGAPVAGTATGATDSIVVNATVLGGQIAPVGVYSDVVNVTVNY